MILAESNFAGLPWVDLTPMILAFVVGIVLCLAGRRVMRLAFTAVGFLAGAGAGWVLTQSIELPVSAWIVIVGLAIVLAAVAALAYKLSIAVVMATVLGVAAPLALITAGEVGLYELPPDDGSAITTTNDATNVPDAATHDDTSGLPPGLDVLDLPPDVAAWLAEAAKKKAGQVIDENLSELTGGPKTPPTVEGEDANASDGANENAGAHKLGINSLSPESQAKVDRAKDFVHDVYARAKQRWDSYPQSLRYNLMGSAAVGALLGLLLGALATQLSASIASAGAGSAICLISASVIAARLGASDGEWLPKNSTTWLMLWFVVAIIGLTIQWTTRPKPVDKAS